MRAGVGSAKEREGRMGCFRRYEVVGSEGDLSGLMERGVGYVSVCAFLYLVAGVRVADVLLHSVNE